MKAEEGEGRRESERAERHEGQTARRRVMSALRSRYLMRPRRMLVGRLAQFAAVVFVFVFVVVVEGSSKGRDGAFLAMMTENRDSMVDE